MKILHYDEPLCDEDLEFAKRYFVEKHGLKAIRNLKQVEVAKPITLMPVGGYADKESHQELDILKVNLRRAGISINSGRKIIWVMPKETAWGARYSLAIEELTGYMPYTFQRWIYDEEMGMYRGEARITDAHDLMFGE